MRRPHRVRKHLRETPNLTRGEGRIDEPDRGDGSLEIGHGYLRYDKKGFSMGQVGVCLVRRLEVQSIDVVIYRRVAFIPR